jgi:hypothetical protein
MIFKKVREVARQNLKRARKKQRKYNEERIQTCAHSPQGRQYTYTQTERVEIGGEVDWAI